MYLTFYTKLHCFTLHFCLFSVPCLTTLNYTIPKKAKSVVYNSVIQCSNPPPPGSLLSHLMTHSGDKPHKCDRCEYSATRNADLVIHQRRHAGERPFYCTNCSYKTVLSSSLAVHMMRKHTGVKPYACSQCFYKSARKGNLDSHMLTHSGDKPFSCDHCPFKTARKGHLTRHLKVCQHAPGPSLPL